MPMLYSVHSAYTMYRNLFKQKENLLEDKRNLSFQHLLVWMRFGQKENWTLEWILFPTLADNSPGQDRPMNL